jgi:hypothetical protein
VATSVIPVRIIAAANRNRETAIFRVDDIRTDDHTEPGLIIPAERTTSGAALLDQQKLKSLRTTAAAHQRIIQPC